MEIPVTTFRGLRFTKPVEHTTLEKVMDDIRSPKWKTRVEKCHHDVAAKDWLPCFTPTGKFSHRSIKGMETYNGVICLDVDHVDDPVELKRKIKGIPWVHAAFITPSGKGVKVIVKTNATAENYKPTEENVAAAFFEHTGFQRDNRCKDIARIQFVSHDPDLYYNPSSTIVQQTVEVTQDGI